MSRTVICCPLRFLCYGHRGSTHGWRRPVGGAGMMWPCRTRGRRCGDWCWGCRGDHDGGDTPQCCRCRADARCSCRRMAREGGAWGHLRMLGGWCVLAAHPMVVFPVLVLAECPTVASSVAATASLVGFTTTIPATLRIQLKKVIRLQIIESDKINQHIVCIHCPL